METKYPQDQLNSWHKLGRNDFTQGNAFWSSYPKNAAEAGLRDDDLDGIHRLFFEYRKGWAEAGGSCTNWYTPPW